MQNPLPSSVAELDTPGDVLSRALDQAVTDTRQCTDLDAPAMRGFMFWSRTNRYLAEELTAAEYGWKHTQRDNILRCIHPKHTHAVTAMSAAGGVGDLDAKVRSNNPKGRAVADVVERNGQLAIKSHDEILYGCELEEIPTWFLLYKRDEATGLVLAELSLPVKMNGKFINEWLKRIPLNFPGLGDPGDIGDLDNGSDRHDGLYGQWDHPTQDSGPDVMVEYRGE